MNKYYTSIFHEANIPAPKMQDTKVNMNISVSQKNIPKVKTLLNTETREDIKNKKDIIRKQQDDANRAKLAASGANHESTIVLSNIKMI